MYAVYTITCQQNGRMYAGYTNDVHKRWLAHKRSPPTRMQADVMKYVPFDDNFKLHVHSRHYYVKGAKAAENAFIASNLLFTDRGYNILKGAPGSSYLFWTIHTHGKLLSQRGNIATLLPHLLKP